MSLLRIPSATYRVQFSLNFRFVDARELVPYLHELGITDLYASPRFKARRGSSHGYDVADPLRVNSELGTDEEFEDLEKRLKHYSMGLLLDIVPNHMTTSPDNPWWMDVLENGPSSEYAGYFDIDWHPSTTKAAYPQENKVLIPILGDVYGNVLENQEFSLKLDETGFFVRYYDNKLPLDPKSYALILDPCCQGLGASHGAEHFVCRELQSLLRVARELPDRTVTEPKQIERRMKGGAVLKQRLWKLYHQHEEARQGLDQALTLLNGTRGDARSFDGLHAILDDQAFRVAFWKLAAEEINYRRFFDVSGLVGLRVDDPKVLEARHALIFQLIQEGKVTGLRIDHIDGLRDPQDYLEQIQSRLGSQERRPRASPGFYVVVEKILAQNEALPEQWAVSGTTGYEFLNAVNSLFVDGVGVQVLVDNYRRFTGLETDSTEVTYQGNKKVLAELFAGEINSFAHELGKLAAQDRHGRDVPLSDYVQALIEVTACLPVYRTYIRDSGVPDHDRHYLERALEEAQRRTPEERAGPPAFAFLRRVLLLEPPESAQDVIPQWLSFVMRWQQFTGAAMAKGVEDTALYVFHPLTSLNEVGGNPEGSGMSVVDVHRFLEDRSQRMPFTLNATSTHDTKRSEDVRARLNVLSELPDEWGKRLERWSKWNQHLKRPVDGTLAPDQNDEVLIYQTLLGAWPFDQNEISDFRERLKHYILKAAREAKVRTSWIRPRAEYEDALIDFTESILTSPKSQKFLKDFANFQKTVAHYGALNSLSQTLLKLAAPGVPDFYQGTDLWDFSLVDPDNRRPVDFLLRQNLLDDLRRQDSGDLLPLVRDLLSQWPEGRIKLYVTYKGLNLRRANKDLFMEGDYIPIEVTGSRKNHVFAFARRRGKEWVIVAVPRLTTRLVGSGGLPLGSRVWGRGLIMLPKSAPGQWRNVFSDQTLKAKADNGSKALALGQVFRDFPVALLTQSRRLATST